MLSILMMMVRRYTASKQHSILLSLARPMVWTHGDRLLMCFIVAGYVLVAYQVY